MEQEVKKYYNIVIYTDGSMRHPTLSGIGYAGGAVHGYIYEQDSIGTINKDTPTKTLSTTVKGYYVTTNNSLKVTPIQYIDGFFSNCILTTNNVMELKSIIESINYLVAHIENINTIYVKTDSSYAISVYENIRDNKPREEDIPDNKKNRDLWVRIIRQFLVLNDKNIKIEMIKVNGHSGIFGNELADKLANHARYMSELNIESKKYPEDKEFNIVKLTGGKKYWKPDIDKNCFLMGKTLFFTQADRVKGNEEDVDGTRDYTIMDYPSNKELGVSSNEALYGMIIVDDYRISEDFKIIENILDIDKEISKGTSMLSEFNLNVFYNRERMLYKDILDNSIYKPNKNHNGVSIFNDNLTIRTFQGLAKLTYNKTIELKKVYDYYNGNITDNENIKLLDITGKIYDTVFSKAKVPVPKKVCKLTTTEKVITIDITEFGNKMKIPLLLGIEILNRNILKRLEKEIVEVKLYLEKKDKVVQLATIIKVPNIIGIYTNLYTRNILLK